MHEAAKSTRETGSEAEKLAQKRQAFQAIGSAATVVGGAMTALTAVVAKTGIEYNTLQQKSRAALTTLLGSAAAANAQMDKLDAFARTSPFSKAVFIQAQQQMLAFGIEAKKVVPYLDAIQNAVAASGGSNADISGLVATMSKIQSSAKITAQDLMEFGNRGVDAAGLIGASMGKTGAQIRQEITAGSLDAGRALDALVEGMDSRFAGAADNVKQTFEGAMDRVQAAWRDLSADLMKPLVDPNGGGALVDFLNWTADIMRAFQALPEPIKLTGGALFAFTGFVALASGGVIGLTPKLVAMKAHFMTLSATMRGFAIAGGTAVAALTLLVAVLATVAAAHEEAEAKARGYADAIRQGEEAVRDFAAQVMTTDIKESFFVNLGSMADQAEQLGIPLGILQKALEGNADALAEVDAVLARYLDGVGELGGEAESAAVAAMVLRAALEREIGARERGEEITRQQAEATDEAADATRIAADATERLADETKIASDELAAMAAELHAVARGAMDLGAAKDDALGAINRLKDAAKQEGVTLDGTNDASIRLRDSMRQVEDAHRKSAEQIIKSGGSLEEARAEWDKGREAVIKQREAMGESREEAEKWADETLGSGSRIRGELAEVKAAWDALEGKKTLELEAKTSAAQRDIDNFVMRNQGRSVSVFVNPRLNTSMDDLLRFRGGNFQGNLYDKGKVQAFYSGGFASGIYKGQLGGIHKFAESEMGVPWETYISGRAADRERNIGIWQETGRRLGVSGGGDQSALIAEIRSLKESLGRPNVSITEVNPIHTDPLSDAWERSKGDDLGIG